MIIKGPWAIITALVVLMSHAVLDAQVVENPAVPRAVNAGRVVVPEEVLSIRDEGTGDFIFRMPGFLKTGPDGSLYVMDRDELLCFRPDGRYRLNYFKKGQGPGEMQYVASWIPTDRNIIIQTASPSKLIWVDNEGKFEREMSLRSKAIARISAILFSGGVFYFNSSPFIMNAGKQHIADIPNEILALEEASGNLKSLVSFSTQSSVFSGPSGGSGSYAISRLLIVPFQEKTLALSHTSEYLLKIYDPAANRVIREFRRLYQRVKAKPLSEEEKKGTVMIGSERIPMPQMKYRNDILNVLVRGDQIWAVTSTRDEKKGILIDVFDANGVYQDAFYMKLPDSALNGIEYSETSVVDGDYLWLIDRAEDETVAIRKYRME